MKQLYLWLLAGLLTLSAPAIAETVYVTDQLRLGLYAGEGATGQRLKLLSSGDALEVLERRTNFARVQTSDGTTGWVKAAFLVNDKPAALIVAETEAARADLQQQLDAVRAEYADVDAVHARLKESLEKANRNINALETELADYRGAERNVLQRLVADPLILGLLLAAFIISLIAGIVIGKAAHERRMRRRFFGLRLGE